MAIVAAACMWGTIGLFARGLGDRGVDPTEQAFWKALVTGTVFVGLARRQGPIVRPDRRSMLVLIGFGVFGVALFFLALPKAIVTGSAGMAVVLLYLAPALVLVAARVLLGTPLTARRTILVAVALAGVALVAAGSMDALDDPVPAVAWGLLSAATYTLWYLVNGLLPAHLRGITVFAWSVPIGAVAVLPFVDWSTKSASAWALLIGLAAVTGVFPYLAFSAALARLDPPTVSVIATIEPVVGTLLAVTVLGEDLLVTTLIGGVMVVGSAALASATAPTG